jgi:hypothetical protein
MARDDLAIVERELVVELAARLVTRRAPGLEDRADRRDERVGRRCDRRRRRCESGEPGPDSVQCRRKRTRQRGATGRRQILGKPPLVPDFIATILSRQGMFRILDVSSGNLGREEPA